ncbi:P-loop containing nucleoside triphosphate hydrolase protein [Chaetomium sp. MPI-CAGE-AT-0009]|nr:P-loop containing nucleoside triphosphate hydrolase protein [Chaetomium sp. MPI-CAGE-AT-0009]
MDPLSTVKPEIDYEQIKSLSMIVIMGNTGSGKSHFINTLAGRIVTREGEGLQSCTEKCQPILLELGRTPVLLIDTPGFDDTQRPDTDILGDISSILAVTYKLGVPLSGIIYMHRITDGRYGGSDVRTFEILKRVCGDAALRNVMLVTTMWSSENEDQGSRREAQLRSMFWPYLLDRGSSMNRFYGGRGSAVVLISQLLSKTPVTLELQIELVKERKKLKDTAAGLYVYEGLEIQRRRYEARVRRPSKWTVSGTLGSTFQKQAIVEDRELERGERKLRDLKEGEAGLDRLIVQEVEEATTAQRMRAMMAKAAPFVIPIAGLVLDIILAVLGIPPLIVC